MDVKVFRKYINGLSKIELEQAWDELLNVMDKDVENEKKDCDTPTVIVPARKICENAPETEVGKFYIECSVCGFIHVPV